MNQGKMIKIRLAKAEDISKIDKLSRRFKEIIGTNNSQYSDEVVYYYKDEISELIRDRKNNIWLVAETASSKKSEIIGILFAKLMSSDWCYIDIIGVEKKYQNRGVGTNLYSELVRICEKRKVSYIQAIVGAKNKNGQQFWKNKGLKRGKTFYWFDREL